MTSAPPPAVPTAAAATPEATRADLASPEVVAGDVARVGTAIDRWALVSIYLGLAFTMVNVQQFAAAGAEPWSLPWLAAWLLDPMVSILLLVVVRAEQITARWQVDLGCKVTAAKWVFFAATYVMNTWASWRDQVPSLIVLHSIPPILVLIGAEVLPVLREGLTEAVLKARRYAEAAAGTGSPSTPLTERPTATGIPAAEPGMDTRSSDAVQGAVREPVRPLGGPPGTSGVVADDAADVVNGAAVAGNAAPEQQAGTHSELGPRAAEPLSGQVSQYPAAGGELPAEQLGELDAAPPRANAGAASPRAQPATFGPQHYDVPLDFDPPLPASFDGALEVEPDSDGSGGDDSSDPVTGDDLDARIVLLTEILRDTPDLGGPGAEAALKAADFQPMSGRTARRLLGKARDIAAAEGRSTSEALGPSTTSAGEQAPTGTGPERASALSLVPRHSTATTSEDNR